MVAEESPRALQEEEAPNGESVVTGACRHLLALCCKELTGQKAAHALSGASTPQVQTPTGSTIAESSSCGEAETVSMHLSKTTSTGAHAASYGIALRTRGVCLLPPECVDLLQEVCSGLSALVMRDGGEGGIQGASGKPRAQIDIISADQNGHVLVVRHKQGDAEPEIEVGGSHHIEVLESSVGTLIAASGLHDQVDGPTSEVSCLLSETGLLEPSFPLNFHFQHTCDGEVLGSTNSRVFPAVPRASDGGAEGILRSVVARANCESTVFTQANIEGGHLLCCAGSSLPGEDAESGGGHYSSIIAFQNNIKMPGWSEFGKGLNELDWKALGIPNLASPSSKAPKTPRPKSVVIAPVSDSHASTPVACQPTLVLRSEGAKGELPRGNTVLLVHFILSNEALERGGKQTTVQKAIQQTLSALDQMLIQNEARNKLIPSIANSLCLCVDLFSAKTGEKQALLAMMGVENGADAIGFVTRRLRELTVDKKKTKKKAEGGINSTSDESSQMSTDDDAPTELSIESCEGCKYEAASERIAKSLGTFVKLYLRELVDGIVPVLKFARFSAAAKCANFDFNVRHLSEKRNDNMMTLSLSKSRSHDLAYARPLRMIQIIFSLASCSKISNKRDIYYMDGYLFVSQATSDNCLETIAKSLAVPRYIMNVVSYSRGLVFGGLRYRDLNGNMVDCNTGATSMPSASHAIQLMVEADAIFVVEKECIFKRLVMDNFVGEKYGGRAILITGCGYPDVQTRVLLSRFSKEFPSVPIYGIADWDPHGMEILSTYTFGSRARSHEAEGLACPSLCWLGVHIDDLERYGVPNTPEMRLDLTAKDKRKIQKMLSREEFAGCTFLREQLEGMKKRGYKVEIEAINAIIRRGYEPLSFLAKTYIHDKLCRFDYWQASEAEMKQGGTSKMGTRDEDEPMLDDDDSEW